MQNSILKTYFQSHSMHLTVLLLVFSTLCYTSQAQTFPFGKFNQLHYNTKSGHTTIKVKSTEVISNANYLVNNGEKEIIRLDYIQRTNTETILNDAFGKGKKITITLRSAGLTTMEQVFYLYDD